jgi:SNF2 family DNA or RNA helicase
MTPQSVIQSSLGVRTERQDNVQDRAGVPQPKRRKTVNENDPDPSSFSQAAFPRAYSDILSHHTPYYRQNIAVNPRPKTANPFMAAGFGFTALDATRGPPAMNQTAPSEPTHSETKDTSTTEPSVSGGMNITGVSDENTPMAPSVLGTDNIKAVENINANLNAVSMVPATSSMDTDSGHTGALTVQGIESVGSHQPGPLDFTQTSPTESRNTEPMVFHHTESMDNMDSGSMASGQMGLLTIEDLQPIGSLNPRPLNPPNMRSTGSQMGSVDAANMELMPTGVSQTQAASPVYAVDPNITTGISPNPAIPKLETQQPESVCLSIPDSSPPKPQAKQAKQAETIDLTTADNVSETTIAATDPVKEEEVCYGKLDGTSIHARIVPAHKPDAFTTTPELNWPMVKVVLRRKAGDQTTKIYVWDHTRKVFGTVDPKTSLGLAPLLDSKMCIRTDCRIPVRRKLPGEEIGKPFSTIYKFDLMLYGPRKHVAEVGEHLRRHNMFLVSPPRVLPGIAVVNPHAQETIWKKPAPGPPGPPPPAPRIEIPGTSQPSRTTLIPRSAEEIRAEVIGLFDTLPKSDELPEKEADPRVKTPLLKHQRQALYFMTSRESENLPDAGKGIVTTLWQQKKDKNNNVYYYNVVTNHSQREKPPPTLGGILADVMGLGKTLSVLSLITKTLDDAEKWSKKPPITVKAPAKQPEQQPANPQFEVPKPAALELTPLKLNSRATLLVCPLSTVTNWEEQIKQHIQPNGLKYHIYHGSHRIKSTEALAQHDLVITTYGCVVSELTTRLRRKQNLPPLPLEEIGWFRIVLDEAHTIRERSTLGFKGICRLQANRRWAVTGTPVQNKLEDLGALLAFLRLKPFDERAKFHQYIIQGFKQADPEIIPKLRILIDTITIRRLKDKIHLPPRTDEIIKLDFSPEEHKVYEWFARSAKERVNILTGEALGQARSVGGKAMCHILRSILTLRLLCAHGKDLLSDEDLRDLRGISAEEAIDLDSDDDEEQPQRSVLHEHKAYEMFYLMQEGNSDLCNLCGTKLAVIEIDDDGESDRQDQDPVLCYMAQCLHTYCPACVNKPKKDEACKDCAHFDKATWIELRRRRAEEERESRATRPRGPAGKILPGDRYSGPHTKTRALVQELLRNKEKSTAFPNEPPFKSVVFSGWTSHLDLIQIALDNAGIVYTRLDGSMSRTQRNAAMDAFRDDPNVQVILVSIMAGGLGLNLTAGNSVYVMEPQFNPAAEAQAVDRVHRLGQTRAVRIVRFIMKDSFEEAMLDLQKKKMDLASLSLDRDSKEKIMDRSEAARQRLLDLRSLFK